MTNATTPTPTPETHVIQHNGLAVALRRTESERAKKGEDKISYWNIDLSVFKSPDGSVNWLQLATLLAGKDSDGKPVNGALDRLQAKLNQDIKSAQLEAGKDIYSMSDKLDYAKAYVSGDFGARRTVTQSPMERAQGEYMAAMAKLDKTAPTFAADAAKLAMDFQTKLVSIATELATTLSK